MAIERISSSEAPYIPFPDHPEMTEMFGFKVYKYIEPEIMASHIRNLSTKVRLSDFDEVLVNLWGGFELFHKLSQIQKFSKKPSLAMYKRIDSGSGVGEIIPVLPSLKNKKVLLVEDILDRGWTIQEILKHIGPGSKVVVAVTKIDIEGQILDKRVETAAFIDNVWVAGMGMDAGFKGEGNNFRNYRGLVAVPQSGS